MLTAARDFPRPGFENGDMVLTRIGD